MDGEQVIHFYGKALFCCPSRMVSPQWGCWERVWLSLKIRNWDTEMSECERERETQKLREKAVRGEEQSIQSAWGSGQAQKLLARIKDESGWRGNIPEEKGIKEGGTKASAGGRTCVCFKAQWAGRRRAVLSHWPVRKACVEASGHSQCHNQCYLEH